MRTLAIALAALTATTTIAGPGATNTTSNANTTNAATPNFDSIPTFTPAQWTAFYGYAARARTLSQKMAKEYFFIAAGIETETNRKNLSESVNLFNSTFRALAAGDASANLPQFNFKPIEGQFESVFSTFAQLQPIYNAVASGQAPQKADFEYVAATSGQLLDTINAVNTFYAAAADKQLGNNAFTQNIATLGNQRTLSQQIAAQYALVYLNVNNTEFQSRLRENAQQFDSNLNQLFAWANNNPAFTSQINGIKTSWTTVRPTITKAFDAAPTQQDVAAVYRSNTNLLETVTTAYAWAQNNATGSAVTSVPTDND